MDVNENVAICELSFHLVYISSIRVTDKSLKKFAHESNNKKLTLFFHKQPKK